MEYFLMPHPPIIIPEVGKGEENKVIKTVKACEKVREKISEINPETIIIISPHGTIFRDSMSIINSSDIKGDLSRFNTNEVNLKYEVDLELVQKIKDFTNEIDIPLAMIDEGTAVEHGIPLELDHGAIVPLYYIDKYSKYKLVHITYSMLSPIDHLKFGTCIRRAVKELDKQVVFIASGDLSHRLTKDGPYEYSESGKIFDNKLIEVLLKGNMKSLFNIEKKLIYDAGECALRSLYTLAGVINSEFIVSDLYSYEGDLGVGYAVMNFKEGRGNLLESIHSVKEKEHEIRMKSGNIYTRLARKSLDYYFKYGRILEIEKVEEELKTEKGGVFVSLKINGDLRGCIGTIKETTESIGAEIIKNSISSALNDYRFPPLTRDEMLELDISVDILGELEETTIDKLNPKEYGVVVSSGDKRGLLLPNIDGVDTVEKQISIAMSKGDIREDEKYSIERFKVKRFKEDNLDE